MIERATAERAFDGVVCFGGEDWWYHNRAHYDMQLMRELSRRLPVLYVNSIGMRVPTPGEGRMFLARVGRKLRSLARGTTRVRPGFAVQSPFVVPGRRGMRLSGWLLPHQVRRAARRVGIREPLAWVACPPAADAARALGPVGLVYQRTDRFETYEGVDRGLVAGFDRALKRDADLVLYCSRHLHAAESAGVERAAFVDHGVDFEAFVAAGDAAGAFDADAPPAVAAAGRPRVGFVGDVDAAVFDAELFLSVARAVPEATFVLVGGCSLPEGWCDLPNVVQVGRVPYEDVPACMAACDVLLMPWHRSEWIEACNPIKLKEYLATGRPVVSTPFPELEHYPGLVAVADGAESFAAAIRAAAAGGHDAGPGRARVADASWGSRADAVLERLAAVGLAPSQ